MPRSYLFLAVIVSWSVSACFHVVDAQKAAVAKPAGGSKSVAKCLDCKPTTKKNLKKSAARTNNMALNLLGNSTGDPVPTCECTRPLGYPPVPRDQRGYGCVISKPSNFALTACRCSLEYDKKKGNWECSGTVVPCPQPTQPDPLKLNVSQLCWRPDTSLGSCYLGGGNCEGYFANFEVPRYPPPECDCKYRKGGCTISTAAPEGTACNCDYKFLWTCSGEVVRCSDDNHINCRFPDKSKSSCKLGRGDCGGY